MILLWIGLLLALILAVVLFTPVVLNIDSEAGDYSIRWGNLAVGWITPTENDLMLRVRLTWWKKEWSLIRIIATTRNRSIDEDHRKDGNKSRKKKKSGSLRKNGRRAINILKSFRVKKFALDIDTDDYSANGILYPVFYFLDGRFGNWNINFNHQFKLQLCIKNSPARVLMALL